MDLFTTFEAERLAIDQVMLGGRLYDAATMNEVETGNTERRKHWWE